MAVLYDVEWYRGIEITKRFSVGILKIQTNPRGRTLASIHIREQGVDMAVAFPNNHRMINLCGAHVETLAADVCALSSIPNPILDKWDGVVARNISDGLDFPYRRAFQEIKDLSNAKPGVEFG